MFRFTIRDVLWLMVVVALCAGWWVHAWSLYFDHSRCQQDANSLRERITELEQEQDDLRQRAIPISHRTRIAPLCRSLNRELLVRDRSIVPGGRPMRYSLRSLLILLAVAPPVVAIVGSAATTPPPAKPIGRGQR